MKYPLALGIAVLSLGFLPPASATSLSDLTGGLDSFAEKTPAALPFAAGAGIDWSNAYMGQLFDEDFPYIHLAVGFTTGFTTIPGTAVNPLLTALGADSLELLPLPFAVANLRLGGLVWPFDVGLKVGFLPEGLGKMAAGYTFDYQNFGVDVRYNLMKSDFWLPDISVGGGINYLKASVSTTLDGGATYAYPTDATKTLIIAPPTVSLDMDSFNFEVKGQVSKTLLYILTPYAGATAIIGSANAKAGVATAVSTTNSSLADWEPYVGSLSALGFSKAGSAGVFGVKLYLGTSLNILILKIDTQLMYNLTDGAAGVTMGARLQL